MTQKAGQSWQ